MSKKHFAAFIMSVVGGSSLFAQTGKDSTVKQLDEVVVTATKSPKKASETGKVVTVITREQIDHSAGKDVAQLLSEQTGVIVNGANSNPGKDKSIFLRGASDKYTLILLDGVPLNDPSDIGGGYDIRLLSLGQIERIEILKGSQSTLYGSNAVAGVINIITRKAVSDQTTGNATLSYGTYHTLKGAADFGRKGKLFEYDLNYQYYNTDGIAEAKDSTGKANFPKNGYNLQAFQANTAINISDNIKISPYFRYSEYKGTYPDAAFAGASNKYLASLVNTGLTAHLNYSGGSLYANYGYDYTQRAYGGAYPSAYQAKFNHAEAFVNHRFSDHIQVLAGFSFQTYTIVKPDTVNSILSPYLSFFYKTADGLNIELGGRYNHDNKYGSNSTYSFNPSYLIRRTVKVFANISSGFRPPSVNELFGPYGANPGLKPEKSNNAEGGVQLFLADEKLSLLGNYFNRTIKDVIIYYTDPVTFNSTYINRDKQHDHGIEAELIYAAGKKFTFRASYTYVDGQITQNIGGGKDTTFHNIVRVPKNNFQFSAGYRILPELYVSSSLQVTGKRTDIFYDPNTFLPSQVPLSSYALWNAYAEYQLFSSNLKIFVDVKNIMDKTNYYEVYGYSVQGRNLTAGIRIKL
ncbi:MAG TPA: TonB-dependent receptor [Puia sp.]|nr:TonB-dependent receptor [Puia sp.]